MNDVGCNHAQNNYQRGQRDDLQTTLLNRGKERRTNLQTDREDEEDKTKLLNEVQRLLVNIHSEVTCRDTNKENPRRSERDSFNLNLTQGCADGDNQRQSQHRVSNTVTKK